MENWEQLNSSILMENTTTVNDLMVYETITYDHNRILLRKRLPLLGPENAKTYTSYSSIQIQNYLINIYLYLTK